MTRDDLRRLFGMVLQDAWLFGGTIRDNIAYGKEGATEEQILAAAEAAHVDHFVRTLPTATTRGSTTTPRNVSRARSSCSPSHGRSWPIRRSSSWTRPRVRWTPAPRCSSRAPCPGCWRPHELRHRPPALHHPRRRPHPGHGQRRASWSRARTRSCWHATGFYYDLYNSQFAEALAEAS